MVVGSPSSVTIIEEGDIDEYDLSNSANDSKVISSNQKEVSINETTHLDDFPFDFLSGETLIEQGTVLTDGCIYLTNYRLFIFSYQLPLYFSFINYPIRLIESIEIEDNIYLCIQCKNIRLFHLVFSTADNCHYWLNKLNEIILTTVLLDDLFAIQYLSAKSKSDNNDYFHNEFTRLQLDQYPWRITNINHDYTLSRTYPKVCIVPSIITDEEIHEVAKFRSHKRFPTVVWRYRNGAIIARTSQPEVGWLFWRSKEDEKMIQAIIYACKMTTMEDRVVHETNANRLLILDARSYTAALVNRTKGGGFEYPPYYTDCDVEYMNLPNIHAVRKSAQMLRNALANIRQEENWNSQLKSSRWLDHLSALIKAASFVVITVTKHARPVLVHCSDGWDRTPQITTLAKIMLDSYYRTIEGFQTLIQCEWIGFGHKFADRCGHGNGSNDPNERSPIFLQWLDCIYQLTFQYPDAFEFNEKFLLKLAYHTYTCLYGTFLCNTDFERISNNLDTRTLSVWSLLNVNSKEFINDLFNQTKTEILYPSSSPRELVIWQNLYLGNTNYTPSGLLEYPSVLMRAYDQSCGDLSTSATNNLHRSTSDSTLLNKLNNDSLSSSDNNSLSYQHQHLLNCSQNSTSTNSLFGPPHYLGTLNDSHHNVTSTNPISLPITNNSDNPNLINDNKSSNITQLASSYHRLPSNMNSADNILHGMPRPQKHTSSVSSTRSSLPETHSFSRTNSYDPNQMQRMPQLTLNKIIKLIRKRIDRDGLTKMPDQIALKMLQQEQTCQRQSENRQDYMRLMHQFICRFVNISNDSQNISTHTNTLSGSNLNKLEQSSFSSWQKIDITDATVTRCNPDFSTQTRHSCYTHFHSWSSIHKHQCRKCDHVFCSRCGDHFVSIPSTNLEHVIHPYKSCRHSMDDNINNNANIESTRTATPMPIQSGCRESSGTSNGSFNSPGGQKVKG